MKRILFPSILLAITALLGGCQMVNNDDNHPLEYKELDVRFKAELTGRDWPADAVVGIVATCTRGDAVGTSMSESKVARYKAGGTYLTPVSEADKVLAKDGDHNFRFAAVYPCPAADVDLTAIPIEVPAVQDGATDVGDILTWFGAASTLSIVPPVEMALSTPFSVLEFSVPDDLLEGVSPKLKKLKVSSETSTLTQSGTYNALTGEFTPSGSGKSVTVDFGTGVALQSPYTVVKVLTAPFTIPEGGLALTLTDANDANTDISALNSEKEIGKQIAAGDTYSAYLSAFSDGIVPVTFPVVFPMGFPTEEPEAATEGYNHPSVATNTWVQEWANDPACVQATRLSEMWTGHHGTLYCKDQPQAYMTWNWDPAIAETGVNHFIETSNTIKSGGQFINISTVGIKGVWTGDYFEFVIPVRKFEAGSTLRLRMALYTRTGPTFWEVLYLDGDTWKSTAQDALPAYPGAEVTAKATWAIPYLAVTATDDNEQSVNMTFANAVPSGEIKIRVKCVDGSIRSTGVNAVTTGNTAPAPGSGNANAPFYFYTPGKRNDQHIRIELL